MLGGDREYSLYDDNMSGSESEESAGEEDQSNRLTTQPTYQYQYQQQQQPAAGNGECEWQCVEGWSEKFSILLATPS